MIRKDVDRLDVTEKNVSSKLFYIMIIDRLLKNTFILNAKLRNSR